MSSILKYFDDKELSEIEIMFDFVNSYYIYKLEEGTKENPASDRFQTLVYLLSSLNEQRDLLKSAIDKKKGL